jgi:NADH dehydrogenase
VKVFVTGATGFVGQEVLRELHRLKHSVVILARKPDSANVRDLQSNPLEVHRGDVAQPGSLPGALNKVDAIVHLVGIISEVGQSTFENIHVRGTENLVAAAQKANVARFVHMSALGTRPGAASRYHQTKWDAEESLRRSGLDYTIFRPSLIFGAGDHFVNLFARLSKFSPILPVIGNGLSRFQPLAVKNVAACFARALAEPKSIGQTLDLCGPETLTFVEMLNQILKTLGRKRLKAHIPLKLAELQAAILEWVFPTLLKVASPLNRAQVIMLQEDNIGDGSRANNLFGLKPIGFREGIAAYLPKRA